MKVQTKNTCGKYGRFSHRIDYVMKKPIQKVVEDRLNYSGFAENVWDLGVIVSAKRKYQLFRNSGRKSFMWRHELILVYRGRNRSCEDKN